MRLRLQFAQGVFWSAAQGWGNQALAILVFVILSRLLDPADFGLLALAVALTAFLQVFADQGFATAIIQRKELEREHLDTAFWTASIAGGVLFLIALALAAPLASLFGEPRVAPLMRWQAAALLLIGISAVSRAKLTREMRFRSLAMLSLSATIVSGAVAIWMAWRGFGAWSLIAKNLVREAILAVRLTQVSGYRPRSRFTKRHFRDLFPFGIQVVGANLLNFVNTRSDDLLIGYFLGPEALGYYTVAYRLLRLTVELMTRVLTNVAVPALSRLQDAGRRLRRAFFELLELASLIIFPVFLGMAVMAPRLVTALYGDRWARSGPVMSVLCLVGLLTAILRIHNSTLLAAGRPGRRLVLAFVDSVTSVVAFSIAARWGILLVAVALACRIYLLSWPLHLYALARTLDLEVRQYFKSLLTPACLSLVTVGMVGLGLRLLPASAYDLLTLLGLALVAAAFYALLLRLLAPRVFSKAVSALSIAIPKRTEDLDSGETKSA